MTRLPESEEQESAIAIVSVALRVLKTRDGINIGTELIEERARNIITALRSEFDLVPVAAAMNRSIRRLAQLNDQLEALCTRGAR